MNSSPTIDALNDFFPAGWGFEPFLCGVGHQNRPVWQKVSTDSLKIQPAPPCQTFLCPAGRPSYTAVTTNTIISYTGHIWPRKAIRPFLCIYKFEHNFGLVWASGVARLQVCRPSTFYPFGYPTPCGPAPETLVALHTASISWRIISKTSVWR
jgi:hypothetical protein